MDLEFLDSLVGLRSSHAKFTTVFFFTVGSFLDES